MKGETITETLWRLKQEAKQSKDHTKQFRYLANGVNRTIINNENTCKLNRK